MEEERESRKLSDHFDKKNLASKRVGYSLFISGQCLRIFVVSSSENVLTGEAHQMTASNKRQESEFSNLILTE